MAGKGRPPKKPADRRNFSAPQRGEWKPTAGVGWQYGKTPGRLPPTPRGLLPASGKAWRTWFASWFAGHWSPDDLPGLLVVIRLYDEVQRGEFQRAGELRIQMDTYGITPKGQQDRRWAPPKEELPPAAASEPGPDSGPYGHLRAVP